MKRYILICIWLSCTALYGLTPGAGSGNKAGDAAATAAYGGTSSVKDTAIRLNIYPNPVTDVVHIAGLDETYSVKIMNVVGQMVASAKGSTAELELDLSDKPVGMYLVRIESQGKSITRKLIKE